jgi:uncharacterized protein
MEWFRRILRGKDSTRPAGSVGTLPEASAAQESPELGIPGDNAMKAVETGDLELLRIALERDPVLLRFSRNNWGTFLHYAASLGRLDSAQYLISAGVDVNARDRDDFATPVFSTIQPNHLEVMELLLGQGALVNIRDRLRNTPLHAAIFHRREAMVKLLISKGADVQMEDEKGRNCVQYAQAINRPELAAYLLERAKTGYARIRLTPASATLVNTMRAVVGGAVNRVSITFEDGDQLHGVNVVEEDAVLLPVEYQHRRISKVAVPKDQF